MKFVNSSSSKIITLFQIDTNHKITDKKMDTNYRRSVEKGSSVIHQGDELFFKRIISRNSSVGYSSRIYYYRSSCEGIPFNWEMQPGTPKEPHKEDILPPISPPPAVLSLGLPKPCINVEEPKPSMKLRFIKFWKKKHGNNRLGSSSSKVDDFEIRSSYCEMSSSSDDGEFMVSSSSPRLSSSSMSSTSSFSFSNGFSFRSSSRLPSSTTSGPTDSSVNRHYGGCSPLNISSILDRVVSRSRRI